MTFSAGSPGRRDPVLSWVGSWGRRLYLGQVLEEAHGATDCTSFGRPQAIDTVRDGPG